MYTTQISLKTKSYEFDNNDFNKQSDMYSKQIFFFNKMLKWPGKQLHTLSVPPGWTRWCPVIMYRVREAMYIIYIWIIYNVYYTWYEKLYGAKFDSSFWYITNCAIVGWEKNMFNFTFSRIFWSLNLLYQTSDDFKKIKLKCCLNLSPLNDNEKITCLRNTKKPQYKLNEYQHTSKNFYILCSKSSFNVFTSMKSASYFFTR